MKTRKLYTLVYRGGRYQLGIGEFKETPKQFRFLRAVANDPATGEFLALGYVGIVDKDSEGRPVPNRSYGRSPFAFTPRQAKTAEVAYLSREIERRAREIDELHNQLELLRDLDVDALEVAE